MERTYNNYENNNIWRHSYAKKIVIIEPKSDQRIEFKSLPYTSKPYTCTAGWNELKTKFSSSWNTGTNAQYINGKCLLIRNNSVVKILPIVRNISSTPFYTPDLIQLIRENGTTYQFHSTDNSSFFEMNGELGRLEYLNTTATAWRFKTSSGDIEDYDADGKLLSITSSNGMKQELFYDANSGLLSRVKDSTGRELLFAYTGNQISSVTVDGNKTTSYTYNASGLITQVTRPDNTTRIYHYEDTRFPTALTGITDERGARYATWTYDAQGRAISSEHAGGAEKTLLTFNADGSTTVTNALNKQTIYRFADIAGARRVTKVEGQPTANCAGANQDYTYTPEGWIASKTDWKGIKTTFTYNTVGQEISRTEAFGTSDARTVTTEWHPTLFVKTKITEPEKETIYTYDANGRLLNQTVQSISAQ